MKFLPLFHSVAKARFLIVGGGDVAQRRAKIIVDAGAQIDVISPQILPELLQLVEQSGGYYHQRIVEENDIKPSYDYIIAATDDKKVNDYVADWSGVIGVKVNVVSNKSRCDFIFPSVIDRSPMVVAVSNSGEAPVMTRLIKEQLEQFLPFGYDGLAALIGQYRDKVKQLFPDSARRAKFWECVVNGTIGEAFMAGREKDARWLLDQAIDDSDCFLKQGEVYLIGAGPGDANLLTLRAFRLIQQSDVVVHDRLVSASILSLIKPGTQKIFVGKQRSNHSVPQQEINQLLVDLARQGKRVARLKGGDPFIFGRGGEEIETLFDENVFFQVVPGVTAANACSCYAGIPLTHRDYAQSVQFVAGHLKNGTVDLNWSELISEDKTLVFYMALNTMPIISENLIAYGMKPDMPVAFVEKGAMRDQRVEIMTLVDVADRLPALQLESPVLSIVGRVVQLADKLAWSK